MDHDRLAARLIKEMRARAGLTQSSLAHRAGVPRPVLSAYENGRRQPSVAILSRIVHAAGMRVQLSPPIDLERNAARFADALSLAEAIPVRRPRMRLIKPVAWGP